MEKISFKYTIRLKILPSLLGRSSSGNVFLQTPYLSVLERSAPVKIRCFYIGIFENSEIIGFL